MSGSGQMSGGRLEPGSLWRVTRLTVAVDGCGEHFVFPTSTPTATLENADAFSTSRLEKAAPFPHSPQRDTAAAERERERERARSGA